MSSDTPLQPPASSAYTSSGNPVDQNAAEARHASSGDTTHRGDLVAAREQGDIPVPSTHGGQPAPANSLMEGASSGRAGDDHSGPIGASDTEGEKMATYGEGEVAAAQQHKTGFGEQADLASDLDRKKAEQAEAREAIKADRQVGAVSDPGAFVDSGT